VTDYVRDHLDREWALADRCATDLEVPKELIYLWAHRYDVERRATTDGTWYRLDQLRAAEVLANDRLTRTSAKRAA
jgi:hypothetical protein